MGERRATETFHAGWAVLGLRSCFDADAATGLRAVYEFRIDDEIFRARIDDGTIETLHGPAQHPDATITMDEEAFLGLTPRTGRSPRRSKPGRPRHPAMSRPYAG